MLDAFTHVLIKQASNKEAEDRLTETMLTLPLEDIQKIASMNGNIKQAFGCGGDDKQSWLEGYEDTPLYDKAMGLEEALLGIEAKRLEKRMNRPPSEPEEDLYSQEDMIRLKKRQLDLELSKYRHAEETGEEGEEETEEGVEEAPPGPPPPVGAPPAPDAEKQAQDHFTQWLLQDSMPKEAWIGAALNAAKGLGGAAVSSLAGSAVNKAMTPAPAQQPKLAGIGSMLAGAAKGLGGSVAKAAPGLASGAKNMATAAAPKLQGALSGAKSWGAKLMDASETPGHLVGAAVTGAGLVGSGLQMRQQAKIQRQQSERDFQQQKQLIQLQQGGQPQGMTAQASAGMPKQAEYFDFAGRAMAHAMAKTAEEASPEDDLARWNAYHLGVGMPGLRSAAMAARQGFNENRSVAGALKGGLLGAYVGALGGAGLGALVNPSDRLGGAVMGGASGALLGGPTGGIIGDVWNRVHAHKKGIEAAEPILSPLREHADIYGDPVHDYQMGYTARSMPDAGKTAAVAMAKAAAELTEAARDKIKPKNFAVPAKKSDTGEPKYPVEDKRHAASALTRVRQFGSPAEKSSVYKAVAKKYPEMAAESSIPAVAKKADKSKESCGM